jgi:nucleoside-diphosphate-sugar epimerase
MNARPNFWAFVDERDSAQAIEKGLTADREGSHVLFINDAHNWLLYDTEKLLSVMFPEVTGRKRPIRGSDSLVSIDKARDLIGFEPEHSVARVLESSPD